MEGGSCYGKSQSSSESNGQNDREASRHRPSMSGVAQAIHPNIVANSGHILGKAAQLGCLFF